MKLTSLIQTLNEYRVTDRQIATFAFLGLKSGKEGSLCSPARQKQMAICLCGTLCWKGSRHFIPTGMPEGYQS